MKMANKDSIGVVGAGIAGITAAYYLAKAGHQVTVYDSERWPAMRCSYANGGQLSVSNSLTWHNWSNVLKGLKWLTKKDAPLLIRPGLDPDRIRWILEFLLETYRGTAIENTAKTIALGLRARTLYGEIAAEEGIKFSHNRCGILHFYRDTKYFEDAHRAAELYTSNGCEWEILSSQQVYDLEPAIRRDSHVVGGVWTPEDGVGDIHKFCTELMDIMVKKYGVTLHPRVDVNDVTLRTLKLINDKVVVCAGAESRTIARYLGDSCTIYPVKGYSITVTPDAPINLPKVSLLDDRAKIVCSTLDGKLRVAGTAELCGYNYDIRADRIKPLLDWVSANFPEINTSNYSSWACLRPMTSNMLPMVQASRVQGYWYHTGHGHLGWTTAPATAQDLVGLMDGN